jgi:tetratricopeptide (TPR) repeat protein
MAEKLSEIGDTYENDVAKMYKNIVNTILKIASRKLNGLINEIDETIVFAKKIVFKRYINYFYANKARTQLLLKDIEGAQKSISIASEYLSEVKDIPYYHCIFLLCQFDKDICRLETTIHSDNKAVITSIRKQAFMAGKNAIRVSKKSASEQTEVVKLMGKYYWLIGRQGKAFKWWSKAVKKGEELGARPDLSRTYSEIGKALLDPKCNYKEWNGMSAQEYLDKARTMFQEMDLQYDLDELDKITANK